MSKSPDERKETLILISPLPTARPSAFIPVHRRFQSKMDLEDSAHAKAAMIPIGPKQKYSLPFFPQSLRVFI